MISRLVRGKAAIGPAPAALAAILIVLCAPNPGHAESWWDRLFGARTEGEPAKPDPVNPTSAKPEGAGAAPLETPVGPSVPVVLPIVQSVTETVELTGNASPVNLVKLTARVQGYLEKIHFQDGAFVKKDDLLFTIQQEQYRAQLVQAEAQVRAQEAALFFARTEVVRYGALQKQGAASQVVVDNWNFQAKKTQAELSAAIAQVEIAKLNLSYTEIRAPFDGLMGKHLVDPGNVVGGPGEMTTLAEIVQLNPIYVVANLSEQDVLRIRANLGNRRLNLAELVKVPVEVGLENSGGYPYRGTIQYVAPAIDPSTGTLLVRGILSNSDRALLPGFFVRMRLPKGRVLPSAMLVPDRALQADQGGRYLLIANANDIVEKRYVQLGTLSGDLRVILSGIEPGDRVIIGEIWRSTPGTKVAPRLTALDAARSTRPSQGKGGASP
jgi:RND family efflux transporter MFP subunit